MNSRKVLKKLIMPLYRNSSTVRYYISSLRMYIDNRSLRKNGTLFYSDFIKKGDLCFDIGANYGNRIELFLLLGAKVIAVEPQDECVEYLKRKYRNKIIIEQKGVGAESGIKDFYVNDASALSTFSEDVKSNSIWGNGNFELKDVRKIEIITLDSLIAQYGAPSFIKIDVEGYEPEVMKGLSQKIKAMSFEYSTCVSNKNLIDCINHLAQISDTITFNFSIGESMKLHSKKWYNKEHFMDIVKFR